MYTDAVSDPNDPLGPFEAVHYGSAYAMSDYETKSQNLYLTTSYIYSPKLKFHGMVGYNKSTAEMDQVVFPDLTDRLYDEINDVTDLGHQNFTFLHMHEYSNLDYQLMNFSLGLEYMLSKDVVWTANGEYADLKDNEEYVYGIESGSMFMIRSGIRFVF